MGTRHSASNDAMGSIKRANTSAGKGESERAGAGGRERECAGQGRMRMGAGKKRGVHTRMQSVGQGVCVQAGWVSMRMHGRRRECGTVTGCEVRGRAGECSVRRGKGTGPGQGWHFSASVRVQGARVTC